MIDATVPPEFQALLDTHGVEVTQCGELENGTPIWACLGDCGCWFIVEGDNIDRWSFVNLDGWCQGQSCPCHDLPKRLPNTS